MIFGIFLVVLSLAAHDRLKAGALPKLLGYLGVVIGAAGLVTVIPALGEVGAIFGLGLIAWWAWLGIVMLRSRADAAATREAFTPRRTSTTG